MQLFSTILTFFALLAGFFEFIVPKKYKLKKYKKALFSFIIYLFVILFICIIYKLLLSITLIQNNYIFLWIASNSEFILYSILLINIIHLICKFILVNRDEKKNYKIENKKIYKDNEYIKIPENISKIERFDFVNCKNLIYIIIHKNVSAIDDNAFNICNKIRKIQIDKENHNYIIRDGEKKYKGKELNYVYTPKKISENLISICENDKEIFKYENFEENPNCKKTKLKFQNLQKIVNYKGNEEYITISKNSIISAKAFNENINIEDVEINQNVFIYPNAFYKCVNINNFIINKNDRYIFDKGLLYSSNFKEILFCSCNIIGNLELNLNLINNVKTIYKALFYSSSFEYIPLELFDNLVSIEKEAFKYSNNLSSITFPKSIEKIEEEAFLGCINLKSVNFHVNCMIDKIPKSCFSQCSKLERINMSNYIQSIGIEAFYNCLELKKINLSDRLIEIEDGAFKFCSNLLGDFIFSTNMKNIGKEAFMGCSNLSNIIFPEITEMTEIAERCFAWCDKLINIKLPIKIKNINEHAFFNCVNLEEVILPRTIKEIGIGAFRHCYKLKKVEIKDEYYLRKIGTWAFSCCENLQEINLIDTIEEIGEQAFFRCKSLKEIKIPEKVKEIKELTFYGCENLETVILPKSIENIEENAFLGCDKLKKIKCYRTTKINQFHNLKIEYLDE